MKIAIVNDIHAGRSLVHQGKERAASHLVEQRIAHFLEEVIKRHAPDILINLGDLIRSESKEEDLIRYQSMIHQFRKVSCPVVHLVGNHELKRMSLEDVHRVWATGGIEEKSFGMRIFGGHTLIWLGLEIDRDDPKVRRLPEGQLCWLREVLKRSKGPILIFTHLAIDEQDLEGNFFYEATDGRKKGAFFLENQSSVRECILESNFVKGVFQGHLHHFHVKSFGGIPFVTCPAMGDNICGPDTEGHLPEIYTILSEQEGGYSVKTYSREYAFAGYEWI